MPRTAPPIRFRDRWRIRWLDHTGKRQPDVFDSYRQADQELRRQQAEVEDVKRGLRAPPVPEKKSVGDALDYWLKNRAPQNVPVGTLYHWVHRKTVPHVRLGPRLVRFPLGALTAWVQSRSVSGAGVAQ